MRTQRRGEWDVSKNQNTLRIVGPEGRSALSSALQPYSVDQNTGQRIPYEIEAVYEAEEAPASEETVPIESYKAVKQNQDEIAKLLQESYERQAKLEETVAELEDKLEQATDNGLEGAITAYVRQLSEEMERFESSGGGAFGTVPVLVQHDDEQYRILTVYGQENGRVSVELGECITATAEALAPEESVDKTMNGTLIRTSFPTTAEYDAVIAKLSDAFEDTSLFTPAFYRFEDIDVDQEATGGITDELFEQWREEADTEEKALNAIRTYVNDFYDGERDIAAFLEQKQDTLQSAVDGVAAENLEQVITMTAEYEEEESGL